MRSNITVLIALALIVSGFAFAPSFLDSPNSAQQQEFMSESLISSAPGSIPLLPATCPARADPIGMVLMSGETIGYSEAGGSPIMENGTALRLINADAPPATFRVVSVETITSGDKSQVWAGVFLGSCDIVYVSLGTGDVLTLE